MESKNLGRFFRGMADLLESPERRAELADRALKIARRVGKTKAMELVDQVEAAGGKPEEVAAARRKIRDMFGE